MDIFSSSAKISDSIIRAWVPSGTSKPNEFSFFLTLTSGLIASTPTGSTAYAFSAGGPVLWPEVEALVLLPISAHALFARPMVISPKSEIVVEIQSNEALLSADALRKFPLVAGDQVRIIRDASKILLSHIVATTFTDRIVAKFKLPVEGWRGE